MAGTARDLALFNLAVDGKRRGCDLIALRVRDVFAAGRNKERASMIQSKTGKLVRFEITETIRLSLERWITTPEMIGLEFLWPSRIPRSPHVSTSQCARIVRGWVASLGLEPSGYGTIRCAGPRRRKSSRNRLTSGRSTATRAFQDGQHGALPRRRYPGCPDAVRGHRPLKQTRPAPARRFCRPKRH